MQIDLTVLGFIVLACLAFIIIKQQRTIDRLTDKLLGIQPATKVSKAIVEEDASPKEDEPKGWYDH